jgi:hypothetical protein
MAQVSIARGTDDFLPDHSMRPISNNGDAVVVHRLPETRPSGAGIELGSRVEQGCLAADAAVNAIFVVVAVLPSEWALRAFAPGDLELIRGELRFPLFVSLLHFLIVAPENRPGADKHGHQPEVE